MRKSFVPIAMALSAALAMSGCGRSKPVPIDLEAYMPRDEQQVVANVPSEPVTQQASHTNPAVQPSSQEAVQQPVEQPTSQQPEQQEPVTQPQPEQTQEMGQNGQGEQEQEQPVTVSIPEPSIEVAEPEPPVSAPVEEEVETQGVEEMAPVQWATEEVKSSNKVVASKILGNAITASMYNSFIISPALIEAQLDAIGYMMPEGSDGRSEVKDYLDTQLTQESLSLEAHYNILSYMMGMPGFELGHCMWLDDTVILSETYPYVEESLAKYGIGIWPTDLQKEGIMEDLDAWAGNVNPSGTLSGVFSEHMWSPVESDQVVFTGLSSVSIPLVGTLGTGLDGREAITLWTDYDYVESNGLGCVTIHYPEYSFGFIMGTDANIPMESTLSLMPSLMLDLIYSENATGNNGPLTFPVINMSTMCALSDSIASTGLGGIFDSYSADLSVMNSSSSPVGSIVQAGHFDFQVSEPEVPVESDDSLNVVGNVLFFVQSPDGELVQLGYFPLSFVP